MTDHNTYLSPFSWRYGSQHMRSIWSEINKRRLWRQCWVALASVQTRFNLVTPEQLADLIAHREHINIPRALEIESEIHHDLMAELKTYAEQCLVGGGILHLGATSMDIEDNADALRIRQSVDHLLNTLQMILLSFAGLIRKYASTPVMAFTHLQPAEPTSLGYRFAFTAQDLLQTWHLLKTARSQICGKGFRGAVGTSAAYADLIGKENLAIFEEELSKALDLPFFSITHQTSPRSQEYWILSILAGLAAILHKFTFDLRLLQSPTLGELSEPFGKKQVGSSAMPFKRNPIQSEKVDSLARSLAQFPRQSWDTTAFSLLERTLDDSASRRTLLPEAFLTADELLQTTRKILAGLQINENSIKKNLATYGPFAATERILMALTQCGADRQQAHEHLRSITMQAWQSVQHSGTNPIMNLFTHDQYILQFLSTLKVTELMEIEQYLGDSPQRALALALNIESTLPPFSSPPNL